MIFKETGNEILDSGVTVKRLAHVTEFTDSIPHTDLRKKNFLGKFFFSNRAIPVKCETFNIKICSKKRMRTEIKIFGNQSFDLNLFLKTSDIFSTNTKKFIDIPEGKSTNKEI